jgi:hypothetical protein
MNVPAILAGALYITAGAMLFDALRRSPRPSAVACGVYLGCMIVGGLILGSSI